jgi:hypothetical protein
MYYLDSNLDQLDKRVITMFMKDGFDFKLLQVNHFERVKDSVMLQMLTDRFFLLRIHTFIE